MADWSESELAVLFSEYLEMLAMERSGVPFVKAQANQRVQKLTGRSKAAIEYKFCNTSAVLEKLGLTYIDGYKPRRNFQHLMEPVLTAILPTRVGSNSARQHEKVASVNVDSPYGESVLRIPIEQLLRKSLGGEASAIGVAQDDGYWPEVPFPPGAYEACKALLEALAQNDRQLRWLFLLGGPGNGKSQLTRWVQTNPELVPLFETNDPAHQRSYDFRHVSDARLRIINDATIRTHDRTLTGDMREAIRDHKHIIANVNRGILVSERLESAHGLDLANFLVNSLLDMRFDKAISRFTLSPAEPTMESFLSEFEVKDDKTGESISVTVVRLDMCSLFEQRPDTNCDNGRLRAEEYRVRKLNERRDIKTSALQLLHEVLKDCRHETLTNESVDPVAANLHTLRSPGVADGLATIFRAAEIASSRLFTFREVWGAISLAILGPMAQRDADMAGLKELVATASSALEGPPGSSEALKSLRRLAEYRFGQVLFFEPRSGARPPWRTPVTDRLRLVDPAHDAVPGSRRDLRGGWATPVLDALEGAMYDQSPIEALCSNTQFAAAVTSFDRALERAVLTYCAAPETRDADYDEAMAWYGRYLMRLYAVVYGIPGFSHALLQWTQAWNIASMSRSLGDDLNRRVKSLLAPPYNDNGTQVLALPVFAPQTIPVIDAPAEPTLVRKVETALLSTSARTVGDRIRVSLKLGNDRVVDIDFDFALVREALASHDGRPGTTELGTKSSPRLERARARIMANRGEGSQWGVAAGGTLTAFYVREHNA